MTFDVELLKQTCEAWKRNDSLERITAGIEMINLGRVEAVRKRQVVWCSNHLSHDDYILTGFKFADLDFNPTCFAAGANVDIPIVRELLPFYKLGAVFIDRGKIIELVAKRQGATGDEREKLDRMIKRQKARISRGIRNMLAKGHSYLEYPQGGRDYDWGDECDVKRGIFNYILDAVKSPKLKGKRILNINMAVDYLSERPEEGTFAALKYLRGHFPKIYPAARGIIDLAAIGIGQFIKRPKPYFFINFGEPRVLNEYAEKGRTGYAEFADYVKQDIERLGRELRESDIYKQRLREVGKTK